MKIRSASAAIILSLAALAGAARAQGDIPDLARALLEAAYETENAEEIEAVKKAVAKVFPDYGAAIEADAHARIAAIAPPAAAEPAASAEPEKPDQPRGLAGLGGWKGEFTAGASFASGNSDNAAVGAGIDAALDTGDFVNNIDGYIDIARQNGITNQKRWGLAYKLDYQFSEDTYAFARIAYDEDEFSGFDYRLFAGGGVGHYLFRSEPFSWKVEGGPGYRYSPIDLTREVQQNIAVFASSEMDWLIREGLVFEQDVSATWTEPTTTIQSITSLTTKLWGNLSTAISYELRYETDPPDGRVNTDQIARASLVYGF